MKTEPPLLPPSISPPPQLQKIYREIPSPLSRLRGRGEAAAATAAIFCSESVLLFSWPGKLDSDSALGEGTMCACALHLKVGEMKLVLLLHLGKTITPACAVFCAPR